MGLEPGSPAWEVGALTRRLKTAVVRLLRSGECGFTCTAPTRWPPLHIYSIYVYVYIIYNNNKVFTNMFNQFNASLLNNSTNSFKESFEWKYITVTM